MTRLSVRRLHRAGYDVVHYGVDHWNGVAIASRVGIDDVQRGFSGSVSAPFDEPRLIAATAEVSGAGRSTFPTGARSTTRTTSSNSCGSNASAVSFNTRAAEGRSIVAGDVNVAPLIVMSMTRRGGDDASPARTRARRRPPAA